MTYLPTDRETYPVGTGAVETGGVGAHVVDLLLAHTALEAGGTTTAKLAAVPGAGHTFTAVATGAAEAWVRRHLLFAAGAPEARGAHTGEGGAGVGAGPARPTRGAGAVVDFQTGASPRACTS